MFTTPINQQPMNSTTAMVKSHTRVSRRSLDLAAEVAALPLSRNGH
jgi:hypothetical protein